ncbi:MAG: hypothetical protein LBE21_05815 [Pseudomonadales bacterium]|nr:hypothetical protein [Pseudomonadales bacterium]
MGNFTFGIAGSGVYLPARWVAAAELDALTGLPSGTVERRFGVVRRYRAGADETTSMMGASAALADANWDKHSIYVIIATCLPYAPHVARQEQLKSGTIGLLIGSSAGISLGGAVIRW